MKSIFLVIFLLLVGLQGHNQDVGRQSGIYCGMLPLRDINYNNAPNYSQYCYNDAVPFFGFYTIFPMKKISLRADVGAETIFLWRERFGFSLESACYLTIGKKWLQGTVGTQYMFRDFRYDYVQQQMISLLLGPRIELKKIYFAEFLLGTAMINEHDKSQSNPSAGWYERIYLRLNFGINF